MPRTDPVCARARVSVCVRVCACARARVCKYTCSLRPGVDVKAEGAGVQGCGGAGNQEGAAGVQETRREHAGGSTQEGARRREHAGGSTQEFGAVLLGVWQPPRWKDETKPYTLNSELTR
jgi:hypothetical protein